MKKRAKKGLDPTQKFLAKYKGKKISVSLTVDDVQRRNEYLRKAAIKDAQAAQRVAHLRFVG